jgi:hypothetical protein
MDKYIWMFPVLFLFHDLEEIIGLGIWYQRNKKMLNSKFPKLFKLFDKIFSNYSTEGMALAVLEELLLCIAICAFAVGFKEYLLWIGIFIAFIVHLIIHMLQSIVVGKYIPALATSIIAMPISIYIVIKCLTIVSYSNESIMIASFLGFFIVAFNLKFAHMLMHRFTNWMIKKNTGSI